MSELNEEILNYLDKNLKLDTFEYAKTAQLDHQKVIGAIKSLQTTEGLIEAEQQSFKVFQLNDEAEHIVTNGSHEAVIFNSIPSDGILQSQLMSLPNAKLGFSKAMANGWVEVDKKADGGPKVVRKIEKIGEDEVQNLLKKIQSLQLSEVTDKSIQDLKKRKLIAEVIVNHLLVKKGTNFTTKLEKPELELTPEMLVNGLWKEKKFKEYNIDALGTLPESGHLHPLLKVRTEIRKIFIEMGFTEIPTNNYVENGFWNFDALFQPQQHPARDAHDTFFLSDPEMSDSSKIPADYLERVKQTHINGSIYGSQGYKCDWKLEEAQKNILRTHTTAVSARMLYKLAQEKPFKPTKYFSIDKVFRNETLDATHLAEFHQIEGVLADVDITLGDLLGVFTEFFKKLGLEDLRFKPAYNPYTEPSMEIFAFHKGLNKWIELGNSGVFRPEMLLPMNLPKNVVVLGWGLSLERPTMIKYGINNIRDLVGHKVNLKMVYENPICRISK
jgi:phenylalanyl-tRNA synthetase alpha chain